MSRHFIRNPGAEQLARALDDLGIAFLLPGPVRDETVSVTPGDLIAGLACSSEARLRLALIPLFLQYPRFAFLVPGIHEELPASVRIILRCYYCAAYYLQRKYSQTLTGLFGSRETLPPLFMDQMGLPADGDPDASLQALARVQQTLSGRKINWHGTYEPARRLLMHAERDAA